MDIGIHRADSRCCSAETNTTLKSNYPPLKKSCTASKHTVDTFTRCQPFSILSKSSDPALVRNYDIKTWKSGTFQRLLCRRVWSLEKAVESAGYRGAHPRELPRGRRKRLREWSPPLQRRPYLVFLNERDRSLRKVFEHAFQPVPPSGNLDKIESKQSLA